MGQNERKLSERVVFTVAEARDEDPLDLPPLEETISAESLDALFREKNKPAGAYTLFPYCGLWVVVHSDGTVDVFEEYAATSAGEQLPETVSKPTPDERMLLLYVDGEEYTFYEDELEELHRIVHRSDTSEEAWEEVVDYAQHQ